MARPAFPRSLPEFFRMLGDERACFDFVLQSRWPDEGDRVCPSCGGAEFYAPDDRLVIVCARCKHIQSATAGTVMQDTRQPLSFWLLAAYLLVTDKRGLSARQLQRTLGLKRYEVAYQMLHKLRAAMVNPERDRLTGRVEVDESSIGGPQTGKPGRSRAEGKYLVVGAVEVRRWKDPKTGEFRTRPGRTRLRHIDNVVQPVLFEFVKESVEPGATVITDGLIHYKALPQEGYRHEVQMHTFNRPQAEVLKHYHLMISNLKAWFHGTFHGAVGRAPTGGTRGKHLQAYLDEFSFRFNRRHNLFAAFQTVLGIAGKVEGPTEASLYATCVGRKRRGT